MNVCRFTVFYTDACYRSNTVNIGDRRQHMFTHRKTRVVFKSLIDNEVSNKTYDTKVLCSYI